MSADLAGRVALVTGAARGIGFACAQALADAGARVAVVDVGGEVHAAAGRIGASASGWTCDVTDAGAVDQLVADVVAAMGRLDFAVNNAGVGMPPAVTADITPGEWRRVLSVNLDGVFYCMRAELTHLVDGGAIVNVASIFGAVASQGGSAAYTASKHAVVGLTKSAALEYASRGIRVNAVGPGYISTPLLESIAVEARAERERLTPLGRLGTPEEVASLVRWLLSDSSRFVTGSFHPVDGGYLAQ